MRDLFGNVIDRQGKRLDFKNIIGNENAKRGLEVAMVGKHNILLLGDHNTAIMLKKAAPSISDTDIEIYTYKPCPCGNFNNATAECRCSPQDMQRHLNCMPFDINKVDIMLEVSCCNNRRGSGEPSTDIRKRVLKAKENKKPRELNINKEAEDLLKIAILELGLSARAYDKVIRIGATIA